MLQAGCECMKEIRNRVSVTCFQSRSKILAIINLKTIVKLGTAVNARPIQTANLYKQGTETVDLRCDKYVNYDGAL